MEERLTVTFGIQEEFQWTSLGVLLRRLQAANKREEASLYRSAILIAEIRNASTRVAYTVQASVAGLFGNRVQPPRLTDADEVLGRRRRLRVDAELFQRRARAGYLQRLKGYIEKDDAWIEGYITTRQPLARRWFFKLSSELLQGEKDRQRRRRLMLIQSLCKDHDRKHG